MISPRPLRTSLALLLGLTAVGLVACSDASTSGISSSRHSTGSTASGSSDGTSTGTGASGGTGAAAGNGGGTSAGTSGDTSGTPSGDTGNTNPGNTGTTPPAGSTPSQPSAPAVAFDVLLDTATPAVNLADQTIVQVTVTPSGGWSGAVALTAEGLPADVTGTFDSATVNVSNNAATTAKLTLKSVSSSAPVATAIKVVGTVGTVVHKVDAALTVTPEITIAVPVNVDSLNPGFGTIKITAPADIANNPVTINFVNLDSTPHEIHAGNKNGFNHGKGTFGQNKLDAPARKVSAAGTFGFYLHDENNPTQNPGTIIIQ